MTISMRSALHRLLQDLVLAIPRLSEMRLSVSRTAAFLRVWHYVSRAGVSGDYLEFGVWEGASFSLALKAAAHFMDKRMPGAPRFFAFDSFSGLPQPDPARDAPVFRQGDYSATRRIFEQRIRGARRGWDVHIIPGRFEESLRPELFREHRLERAAFVTIDCDLYAGALAALRFVTPLLGTGTILYFDDWYFTSGDMTKGEAGACRTWLSENPDLRFEDFGDVGIMGKLFIVTRC